MIMNYKTTIAGLVTAAVYAWANAGNVHGKQLIVAVLIAVTGALCKDFDVTGGTTSNK